MARMKNAAEEGGLMPFIGDLYNSKLKKFHLVTEKMIRVKTIKVVEERVISHLIFEHIDLADAPQDYNEVVVGVKVLAGNQSSSEGWRACGINEEAVTEEPAMRVTTSCLENVLKEDISVISNSGHVLFYVVPKTVDLLNEWDKLFIMNSTYIVYNGTTFENRGKIIREAVFAALEQMKRLSFCVADVDAQKFEEFVSNLNRIIHEGIDCQQKWPTYDVFLKVCKDLLQSIQTYKLATNSLKCEILAMFNKYNEKVESLSSALKDGVGFMNHDQFITFVQSQKKENCIFLFISDRFEKQQSINNFDLFLQMKRCTFLDASFHIVDIDVESNKKCNFLPISSSIRHYSNGKCLCSNMEHLNNAPGKNLVLFQAAEANSVKEILFSEQSTLLVIACPDCPELFNTPSPWSCHTCLNVVEYLGNGMFSCGCGNYHHENMHIVFQCNKYYHKHRKAISKKTRKLIIQKLNNDKPLNEINILLIGQTGVGKSTWINSFANYLRFPSFEEALGNDPITLVANKFSIDGKDETNAAQIVTANDVNEDNDIGASATQNCRSYVLYQNEMKIRLIDTPGLGDTRGYEHDCQHVKNIMQMLQNISKIHAVCLLLMPNETRRNAGLVYATKEIMCYMHTSVIPNFFLVFTNTRSTAYRPGETFPLLHEILNDANVKFLFNLDNVFSFDNESYKFLYLRKFSTIQFSDTEINSFKLSWNKSQNEIQRFLHVIAQKKPYIVKWSINLAIVRFKLMEVLRNKLRAMGYVSTDSLIDQLEYIEENIKRLRNNESVEIGEVENVPCLPQLVCGKTECCRFEGVKIYTPCLVPCFQSDKFNTRPNPELMNCDVFRSGKCSVCKCRWQQHMVINYKQIVKSVKKENVHVSEQIIEFHEQIENYRDMLILLENSKIRNAIKREKLGRSVIRLSKYLKSNSIFSCNNRTEDYLSFLIHSLDKQPNKTFADSSRLQKLNENKNEAKEIVNIMDKLSSNDIIPTNTEKFKTIEEISYLEENLAVDYQGNRILSRLPLKEKSIFI